MRKANYVVKPMKTRRLFLASTELDRIYEKGLAQRKMFAFIYKGIDASIYFRLPRNSKETL